MGAPVVMRTALSSVDDIGKPIQAVVEERWFGLLNRALVGRVGLVGDKGVGFSTMMEWVEIRSVGDQDFLFVFPSREEAKNILRRQWVVNGCDPSLRWWSPSILCDKGKSPMAEAIVWVKVVDELSANLGVVRLQIRGHGIIPTKISLR
ncbi:hypothetical protein CsSME_00037579 [Camellia sinensis var. sinensis]